MGIQTVFKRYELKYMLSPEQKNRILKTMSSYMELDKYGRTTIRNSYFDTDNYRLIRRSIEKPVYKEKLRVRSYTQATDDSTVFVELKKKYDDVVFKRRIALRRQDALGWLYREQACPVNTQISREIDYFIGFYETLTPKIFLSYEREAFFEKNGGDFRVTFDDNILFRQTEIDLCSPVYGTEILGANKILMEIKCSGGIPLWMVEILSKERIYKTSFSKYGAAYCLHIYPENPIKIYEKHREIISNGNFI